MPAFIEDIHIKNFKSLRHVVLSDCRRINLLIGRANTGKSNFLEALSLFSLPFLREHSAKHINAFIRLENPAALFYNGDCEAPAVVETTFASCVVHFKRPGLSLRLETIDGRGAYFFDEKLRFHAKRSPVLIPFMRRYIFSTATSFKRGHSSYLIPPNGDNLFDIAEHHPEIKSELKFNRPFPLSYQSTGDSYRRVIFFRAAILSNKNSVLLFDEPIAHIFPPFFSPITQEMIYDKSNQYFIATSNEYLINELVEDAGEELAMFEFRYDKRETTIRRFAENELAKIHQHGVDVFTNNKGYI